MATKNHTYEQFYNMFIEQLQDVLSAEEQIIKSTPKLLNIITTKELKDKLKTHMEETNKQRDRLLKIFKELKETPKSKHCEGMHGLLVECEKIAGENISGIVKDAVLICMLQKIEHYEIATYGALRTFAKHLGKEKVENLLQEILDEEWSADEKLTKVAEGGWFTTGINAEAVR